MKIVSSVWFTPSYGPSIGIVEVEVHGWKKKKYVWTATGTDEDADAKRIAEFGARFE